MPSAKSKAAKAATAARVAAYNAAAAALDADPPVKTAGTVDIGKLMNITGHGPPFDGLDVKTAHNMAMGSANTSLPFKPTLPSMLNLNTSPNMNRALAVGAVVLGAGQNGNPSDEENVHPGIATMPAQKEAKCTDGVGYVARPLSPILGNIDNEKSVRAYEFERQKAKRAGELTKRKAAKAAKTSGHSHGGRVGSEETGGRREVKSRIGSDDMEVDIAATLAEKKATSVDKDKADRPSNGRIEVSLSELVLRPKKPRKVKEDDFEVISPVRSVIVLDDLEARDMEMDEAWEHVEADLDGKKSNASEASYAAVVVGIGH